jgi:hypothetical protein
MDVIEKSGAEYVLFPKHKPHVLVELPKTGRWRVLYEDEVSGLLIRADVAPPSPVVATPDSAWRRLAQAVKAARFRDLALAENELHRALDMMPYNGPACRLLIRVQMARKNPEAARRTLDRCERVFPRPEDRSEFEEKLEKMGST